MQCTTSLGLSNVLGAHILVQELALSSWSWSICSMEGLPEIFLGPWNHLLQGGPWGSGGAVWRMSLDQVTRYLSWREWSCQLGQSFWYYVMPLKGEAYFYLQVHLQEVFGALAYCTPCARILFVLFVRFWGVDIPSALFGMIYCTYPCIFLHFLACFCMFFRILRILNFHSGTSQFMK